MFSRDFHFDPFSIPSPLAETCHIPAEDDENVRPGPNFKIGCRRKVSLVMAIQELVGLNSIFHA